MVNYILKIFQLESIYEAKIKPLLESWPGIVLFFFGILASASIIVSRFTLYGEVLREYFIETFLVVGILSIVLWFFQRRLHTFAEDEIGIVIALTKPADEDKIEVNKELRRIYDKLMSVAQKEKLSSSVSIKMVSDRYAPQQEQSAFRLRDRMSARLIIWGNVEYGNIADSKQTVFTPIYFSFRAPFNKDEMPKFTGNLSAILRQRKWVITERNSIIDRSYIAKNIYEVCLYILGFSYIGKDQDVAYALLTKSLNAFKSKQNITRDERIAIWNIGLALNELYNVQIKNLELFPGAENLSERIKKAEEVVENLKKDGFGNKALLLQGSVSFLRGDLANSEKVLHQVEKMIPNDITPPMSLAFLYYYQGNIDNGTEKLLRAIKSRDLAILGDQSTNILSWYEYALAEDKSKLYLNFPLGIIYYDLSGDKILAKEYLEAFLKYYKQRETESRAIRRMVYESERRIRKLPNGL